MSSSTHIEQNVRKGVCRMVQWIFLILALCLVVLITLLLSFPWRQCFYSENILSEAVRWATVTSEAACIQLQTIKSQKSHRECIRYSPTRDQQHSLQIHRGERSAEEAAATPSTSSQSRQHIQGFPKPVLPCPSGWPNLLQEFISVWHFQDATNLVPQSWNFGKPWHLGRPAATIITGNLMMLSLKAQLGFPFNQHIWLHASLSSVVFVHLTS